MSELAIFNPKPLNAYEDLVKEKNDISLSLNQQEAAVVLKAFDYGLDALNADEIHLVNCVLASVKQQLWP